MVITAPVLPTPARRIASLILPACLFAGCGINSGSAPTYAEYQAAAKDAEATIAQKGTVLEKQYPPGKGHEVTLTGASITDSDIASLRTIDNVAELDLSKSTISDAQLIQLVAPRTNEGKPPALLFRVDLSDTSITDAGLKTLTGLQFLAEVNVKGSKITDAGVKAFEQAKSGEKLPFGLKLKIEQ